MVDMSTDSTGPEKSTGQWKRVSEGWQWEGPCPTCTHTTWVDLMGGQTLLPGQLQVGGWGFGQGGQMPRQPSIAGHQHSSRGRWPCVCGKHEGKGCGNSLEINYPE